MKRYNGHTTRRNTGIDQTQHPQIHMSKSNSSDKTIAYNVGEMLTFPHCQLQKDNRALYQT